MAAGEYVRRGLERLDDGRLIGNCTLFDLMLQCRRAEIGYVTDAGAWGRGYRHEALQALLEVGLSQFGLNRIEADIDPCNAASARILERLGLEKEGHLRERWIVNGVVSDTWLCGLLLSDWTAPQGRRLASSAPVAVESTRERPFVDSRKRPA